MAPLPDKPRPSVACIVLNWNNDVQTCACLAGLRQWSGDGYSLQVVVVDNGSAEYPEADIAAAFPGATQVRLPQNLGFAAGCNAGAATAAARTSDYLLFLNNDTLVENDFLASLVGAMQTEASLGMVSPVERIAGTGQVSAFHVRIDLNRGATYNSAVPADFDLKSPRLLVSDSAHGGMLLIRRRLFEDLGGFDASYFAYFEDVDLALRARRQGFVCGFYISSEVYHFGGDSTRQHDDQHRGNIVRACLNRRNSILLVRRHASWRQQARFFSLHLPRQVLRFLLKSVVRRQWKNVARYLHWTFLGLRQPERISPPPQSLRELGLQ